MVPPELTFWSSRVTIGHRAPVYMLESPVGDKAPEACVPSSPSSTPAIWGISPNLSGILFLFREVRWLDQICSKLPSNSYQIRSSMNLSWMNQSILNLPDHSFQTVSHKVSVQHFHLLPCPESHTKDFLLLLKGAHYCLCGESWTSPWEMAKVFPPRLPVSAKEQL